MNQQSVVITITGNNVIGKRAIAYSLQRMLQSFNIPIQVLDHTGSKADVEDYPIQHLGALSLMREKRTPVDVHIAA